ncbi:hypothetical protein LUZ60_001770 [Juncus effusus]|nr:hypothetical protein LUZ60_001770 [Juncus effusus]
MASKRLAKSLPSLIAKHKNLLNPSSSSSSPSPSPSLPSITLSSLPLPPSHISSLNHYLSLHFPSLSSLTPSTFSRFLRRKIRYHSVFSQYDFHLFLWASNSLSSFRHDHHSHLCIVQSLSFSSRLNHLRLFLSHVKLHPCPCTDSSIFSCPYLERIYGCAILAFCRAGWLDDADVAFREVSRSVDGKLSSSLYNLLLHGFVKQGKHDNALQLFDKMTKRDFVQPDSYTFNIMINSFCIKGEIDLALNWLRKMREMKCEPNIVSFNTIIRGFFRRQRFKEGLRVAYEMLDFGTKFSVSTCEILIHGLCNNGKVNEAADLLVELLEKDYIPKEGFDCFVLMESLCKNGDVMKALKVFDEMAERRGGSSFSEISYITLIEGLRKYNKLNEACRVMETMIKEGLLIDNITCNCLFEDLCNLGKTMEANKLRLLAKEKGFEGDGTTFCIILRGFVKEGRKKEGELVLDEMLDGGFIPNITTYNRFLDSLQK